MFKRFRGNKNFIADKEDNNNINFNDESNHIKKTLKRKKK